MLVLSTSLAQCQINMVRYNDNFSNLKNDTIHKKGFDKLKYISLFKNANISFGGEIREQYQYYENQNFGDVPSTFTDADAKQIWQRVMVHTNIELGNRVRIFAQLGSTFRFGNPNPLTPEIDENQLSLHQAFIDYNFHKKWTARLGRQEISYGNNRLITFREGPNTRLTFDAAILKYHSKKRKWDIFALTPVISRKGIFDDQSFEDAVVGIYATEYVIPHKLLLDSYTIFFNSDRRKYNYAVGHESRETTGLRIYSENPIFNYEIEASYQDGKFNNQKISAFGINTDFNYKLVTKNNLILGVSTNYVSGDKNQNDNQLNTYNTIFSKPPFGLVAPIGLSNIISINPYFKINPTPKIYVYASFNLLWRQSNQDGIYSPGTGAETRPNTAMHFPSTKQNLGTLLVLESSYSLNKHLTIGLDASYFFAGNYIKETGKGKDIVYVSSKIGYKF